MGTIAIAVLTEKRREHSKGLRVTFGEYSDTVENDILTMERFLDVSRFCTLGVGRYAFIDPTTEQDGQLAKLHRRTI